jgi:hypothetical protein
MSKLTLDDKQKLSLIECPDGTCAQQVVLKEASSSAKVDTELYLLCDSGNNDTKFYSVVKFLEDGTFDTIESIDLSGVAYTPVGPVEMCSAVQEVPEYEIKGFETLSVVDSATTALTIPADAISAYLQFQIIDPLGTDGNPRGAVRFYKDGRTPATTVGFVATDLSTLDIGYKSENATWDEAELANFLAIAEPGVTAVVEVTYYGEK